MPHRPYILPVQLNRMIAVRDIEMDILSMEYQRDKWLTPRGRAFYSEF
jgi:hypothetical protein